MGSDATEEEKTSVLERQVYLDERKMLIEAEKEQSKSYDQAILTLSAGALGLSLTFIKDIVPKFNGCTTGWLIGGWVLYTLSLLSTLTSFVLSQVALRRQRDVLDNKIDTNPYSTFTVILNVISLIAFIVATLSLVIFVSINIGGRHNG